MFKPKVFIHQLPDQWEYCNLTPVPREWEAFAIEFTARYQQPSEDPTTRAAALYAWQQCGRPRGDEGSQEEAQWAASLRLCADQYMRLAYIAVRDDEDV